MNDQGVPVNSGSYVVQLVSREASKETVVSSRSVVVLKGADTTDPTASAFLAPNPGLPGQALSIHYDPSLFMGKDASCRIYNMVGELVGVAADPSHSGRMMLPQSNWASGTYLVRFEVRQGNVVLKARVLKLAIVR